MYFSQGRVRGDASATTLVVFLIFSGATSPMRSKQPNERGQTCQTRYISDVSSLFAFLVDRA